MIRGRAALLINNVSAEQPNHDQEENTPFSFVLVIFTIIITIILIVILMMMRRRRQWRHLEANRRHILQECPAVQPLWTELHKLLRGLFNTSLPVQFSTLCLGILDSQTDEYETDE